MWTESRSHAVRSISLALGLVCSVCLLVLPVSLAAGESKEPKSKPAVPAASEDQSQESIMSVWETRVHAALRRESSAKGAEQEQAARDLVALYESLEKAKGIDKGERAELRGLVRNRLTRVSQRISRRLEKAGKKPAAVTAAKIVTQSTEPAENAVAQSDGTAAKSAVSKSTGGTKQFRGQPGQPTRAARLWARTRRTDPAHDRAAELGRQRRQRHDHLFRAAAGHRRPPNRRCSRRPERRIARPAGLGRKG